MTLADITAMLQAAKGITHKRDIAPVLAKLNLGGGNIIPVGDDCAAIPDGHGYLLLAIEGFMPEFVAADPHFAGYCGVMVNLSDVAAMGGRPIAVVDAIWTADATQADPILAGLHEASHRYNVPIIGGHTNTRAASSMLSVAILGRAKRLLCSFHAKPHQTLIAAIDLRGRMRDPALYWDASTGADRARLNSDLEILPALAEERLCAAAKDISMAGVVGTALMLLEASRLGAAIDLAAIPRPPHIPLASWLLAFPSFGFILSVKPENVNAVIGRFAEAGIPAAAIGHTDASHLVRLSLDHETSVLWNFDDDTLIGAVTTEMHEHA
jgi:AIR synthase-related protein